MADERALAFFIKQHLDKIQEALQKAQREASRTNGYEIRQSHYFTSGIFDAREAAQKLTQTIFELHKIRQDDSTKNALAQASLLLTDIDRFDKEPELLKLKTALSHLDALIEFTQKKLDQSYQRTNIQQTAQQKTLTKTERKEQFLRLWQTERGTSRLRNILEDLITLKQLITRNVILEKSKTLNASTQKRTAQGETQTEIEQRTTFQLRSLYDSIFKPCIIEGELSAFKTQNISTANLLRKCDTRTVFLNRQPLEDPIVLIASDILCAQATDIADIHSGWLNELIGAKFTVISLVSTIIHLKDAVFELADILPAKELTSLRGLFLKWHQTDNQEFSALGQEIGRAYPYYYARASNFDKGL